MIFYILLDGICVISTCILTENIYILMRCFHDFQFQKAIKFLSVPEPRQFWEQSPHKLENIIFSFGSKLGWRIPNQSKKKCKIHRWSTPQTKNIFHFCAHWNTSECILLQNKFLLLSAILLGLFENGNEASRQEEGQSSGEILEFLNFDINTFLQALLLPLSFKAQYSTTQLVLTSGFQSFSFI